ncbi:MAG: prepilin-type N-terminal cleavage/methylation domain-containing protein, partial [Desulfonatronovibrio sp.]
MSWLIRKDQKGFTLIELLLALAILGVVTYFIVSLTSSVRQGGKAAETSQRMEIISAKMKEYYRAQGEMPDFPEDSDGTTLTNEVPVDRLNLEAKYKFDGWGQPIYYHFYNDGSDFDPKVINEVEVDGVDNMAGYLLIYGGDQDDAATLTDDDNTAESAGDDILMAINVNREAMEIALDEVRELQRRVNQFDNLFAGVDNSETCGIDTWDDPSEATGNCDCPDTTDPDCAAPCSPADP